MANSYIEGKIRNYDLYADFVVGVLVICSFIAGRFFYFYGLLNVVTGLFLGVIVVLTILLIKYFINKQRLYIKGLYLEKKIAGKLDKLNIDYKQHVETDYGDLDLLITKGNLNYGVEAKNWAGKITFENNLLKISGWDNTDVLSTLLKHCKLARNKEFGENSNKFIKPMLIFGYNADIHIPHNKVMFNGVEIVIATIRDFELYI